MKMEQTERSETLACELQTLVNHPEESIRQIYNINSMLYHNNLTNLIQFHFHFHKQFIVS
jgi:hypothetical protein